MLIYPDSSDLIRLERDNGLLVEQLAKWFRTHRARLVLSASLITEVAPPLHTMPRNQICGSVSSRLRSGMILAGICSGRFETCLSCGTPLRHEVATSQMRLLGDVRRSREPGRGHREWLALEPPPFESRRNLQIIASRPESRSGIRETCLPASDCGPPQPRHRKQPPGPSRRLNGETAEKGQSRAEGRV